MPGTEREGDREPAIRAERLSVGFGDTPVLEDVGLSVERGEVLVILGGSGSGKSTLLRCLLGLTRPSAGHVWIDGIDPYAGSREELTRLRQRIGVAFQAGALFGSMTLAENIDLPLSEYTALPASTRRIVARIKLSLVGLEDAIDRMPAELSGGMAKRAALARALALDPDVVFLDEPTAGLDPVTAAGLDRLLLRLQGIFGMTVVVVTHDLDSAFAIADRIAVMHEGRFVTVSPPAALRASDHPVVRRFLERKSADEPLGAG